MCAPQGELVRQGGMTDSRLSHVEYAIRFIRDQFAESIRAEQLAELTNFSESSLRRYLRAVTGLSPIRFQKQIRLQTARARLLAEPEDAVGIGFAVGYESASQFSREFGAPPGQDAEPERVETPRSDRTPCPASGWGARPRRGLGASAPIRS
jgi:transcriptional regulator GlxA family with amidase domain